MPHVLFSSGTIKIRWFEPSNFSPFGTSLLELSLLFLPFKWRILIQNPLENY